MKNLFILLAFALLLYSSAYCQKEEYHFTIRKEVPSTPVKNQSATSTCWCFSGLSFFESELMREGKKPYNLSEMYTVRETYQKKAEEYVKRRGECSFSGSGEYQDLLKVSRDAGFVPNMIYPGLNYGDTLHDHNELDAVLKGYMNGLLRTSRFTPAWYAGFTGILDAYLGKVSETFQYDGKIYTPKSFTQDLGLNMDDYIVFSSFTDHPYYKQFVLEVPDNWDPGSCYNLPLNEFIQVIDNALLNGFSVAWACDMRGKGFSMKDGVAVVPDKDWDQMSESEAEKVYLYPHKQKEITPQIRQKEFRDHAITGDHGMHIIGIAQDQKGNIFYKVKNSWGPVGKYNGYIYVSREFVMLKTTNCMINRNAIPAPIAEKIGIETAPWQNGALASDGKDQPGKSATPGSGQ